MTPIRFAMLAAACCGVAACGQRADLKPAAGQALPVKPLLAKTTPSAEELLEPTTQARPARVDELIKRSEPRRPDRFDLPPPDGQAAPLLPAPEDPAVSEKTGVSDPQ